MYISEFFRAVKNIRDPDTSPLTLIKQSLMEKYWYVYILANHRNGTLYTGFTNNLIQRTWTHKNDVVEGFTNKYQVHRLVYYEVFEDRDEAIKKEKQIKKWHRKWKLELIEKMNPNWEDLYDKINKG